MAFIEPKESYTGKINQVTIGAGEKAASFGGENGLPFLSFEGQTPNKPLIAYEIQDVPPDDWTEEAQKPFKDVSKDTVKWAKFCQNNLKAQAIALRLIGTHPDKENFTPEQSVNTIKTVLSEIDVPLIILGSNHIEKDAAVLVAAAEAAKGKNCIIGKAQEGNYRTITAAAIAHNHKLIAMSELDINLSKQLNILIAQLGLEKEQIIIDPMCSALGYGLEYTYSVMERIRLAALIQNDPTMQCPMLADVGMYTWKIKESQAPETDAPLWGNETDRGIAWEAATASALLMSGAELLIMRHPKAVSAVEKIIEELT